MQAEQAREHDMEIRKKLSVVKKIFTGGRAPRAEALEQTLPDADELQLEKSLRRKLGGAEARGDEEDDNIFSETPRAKDTGVEAAPAVEILEDD